MHSDSLSSISTPCVRLCTALTPVRLCSLCTLQRGRASLGGRHCALEQHHGQHWGSESAGRQGYGLKLYFTTRDRPQCPHEAGREALTVPSHTKVSTRQAHGQASGAPVPGRAHAPHAHDVTRTRAHTNSPNNGAEQYGSRTTHAACNFGVARAPRRLTSTTWSGCRRRPPRRRA